MDGATKLRMVSPRVFAFPVTFGVVNVFNREIRSQSFWRDFEAPSSIPM
jgi:hypothetical protein